jgi:Amt family ammonium transporter
MTDSLKYLIPALVFWMGVVCWQAGMVRSKNVVSVMLSAVTQLCVVVLEFYVVGAAFCPDDADRLADWPVLYGGNAGLGWLPYVLLLPMTLAGAVAERGRFFPLLVAGCLLGIVGPLVLRTLDLAPASWQPLKNETLFFFGAILLGASAALTLAMLVGPRQGKFNRDGSTTFFPGHSVPMQVFGAIAIVFSLVVLTRGGSMLSAAAGLVGGLVFGQLRFGKPDPICILTGLVAGAVAGAAVLVNWRVNMLWHVLAIGGIVGFVAPWAALLIELRGRIDDPSMLAKPLAVATALPMVLGWLVVSGTASDVARRVGGALLTVVLLSLAGILIAVLSWLILRLFRVELRVRETDEYDGLDLAVHDINAYPDFQQTMIKSHHMRQA